VLRRIVLVVATLGVAFVASGVCWRYVCPRFVDLPDHDLGLLAVRDGVGTALVLIGFGIGLTALGSLELYGFTNADGTNGVLVTLVRVLPVREAGGLLVAGGFGLVCASLLVPVGTRVRRRIRG
jgi:hypothetical protein